MTSINNKVFVIILIVLASVLFFFKLGSCSLYDAAETTYGEFIKQIRLTGDWLTMHYNGEIIFDKPPLYFWLATAATFLFGLNEWAIRFWAALCGVLTVVTTYYLGKSFYNERTGFLSGIIVMTAFQFLIQSRIAEIDILLTLLMTVTFLCFWHKRYLPMYLFAALGMITKGIIGAVLPGCAIFLYLLLQKDLKRLAEMKIPFGLLIIILVAGPWNAAEWILHGEKFTQFILGFLFMSRFQGVVSGHPGPWYYYFLVLILGFAPWSHFLPYALVRTWRNLKLQTSKFKHGSPELLTLCFIIPTFLVFSIAKTKLPNYVFPLYPFLAIMVGKLWDDLLNKPATERRGFLWSNSLLLVVVGLIIFGFIMLGTSNYSGPYQELLPNLILLASVLIASSLVSILWFLASKYQLSFYALPAMVFIITYVLTTQTLPLAEKYKGAKELGQQVAKEIQKDEVIAAYNTGNRPGVVFYNVKPIVFLESEQAFKDFLKQKNGYCFTTERDKLVVLH